MDQIKPDQRIGRVAAVRRLARRCCKWQQREKQTLVSRRAFSVIELIAVLSIIALLGAALVPSLISRADVSAKTSERLVLKSMAQAVTKASAINRQIPDAANIPALVGSYLGYDTSRVVANPRTLPRRVLVDPLININGNVLP